MIKILKYSFFDLIRSRWSYTYFIFSIVLTSVLLYLSGDFNKVIISLMNIVMVLAPLIATIFGVMHYYNSRSFIELLLAQPIKRSHIFIGQYLGLALSLTSSLLIGIGIPFILYGIIGSSEFWNFAILLISGFFLTFIFSALALLIALKNENKIKGFGLAILLWLFLAVIYDGGFLLLLLVFSDYPLENFSLAATMFNPIDLSRILVLLKLDISALLGYTGAVFGKFFKTTGVFISFGILILWVIIPILGLNKIASKKDF